MINQKKTNPPQRGGGFLSFSIAWGGEARELERQLLVNLMLEACVSPADNRVGTGECDPHQTQPVEVSKNTAADVGAFRLAGYQTDELRFGKLQDPSRAVFAHSQEQHPASLMACLARHSGRHGLETLVRGVVHTLISLVDRPHLQQLLKAAGEIKVNYSLMIVNARFNLMKVETGAGADLREHCAVVPPFLAGDIARQPRGVAYRMAELRLHYHTPLFAMVFCSAAEALHQTCLRLMEKTIETSVFR
ncbi:MAG: hypothetical protein A3J48_01580 [Candidatus Doudnabacteria bacterium RIFCSPHIGHO2_02_FULL_46_11]|uniref:Uncharacterized protein n=1 Tax=Candidatus Doudnabacteria bacterium RIFCSPHIGHO2_02_FULL_46_11 TaxID=1817832 RepID=A0A1F5PA49_9BACT|nr:MAG: hypothetical protein A3J48_01580 [Candidatus Doudnabacteria bacterium RIFCSPHIGHO2_02_FULL_46_11]